MLKKLIHFLMISALLLFFTGAANATLNLRSAYQDAAISVDAWGGTENTTGYLQSDVPAGSTVLAAFLYSSNVWGGGAAGDVTLNGTFYSQTGGSVLTPDNNSVTTRVYDVTSAVKTSIEAGSGIVDHSIVESGYSDGEVLAVIYSNASTVGNTAIIMDGELSTTGDSTTLNFANPYTGGDLFASLAISYSYGNGQYSQIDVTTDSTTNRRLTGAAGGNDDGGYMASGGNGRLITAGGVGDDPANPGDPSVTGEAYDDELYNLALGNDISADPFINAGDTFLRLDTRNPSNDDNVFALFLSSTFSIDEVDDQDIDDDPDPVPEPGTFVLFGIGLLALAGRKRRN